MKMTKKKFVILACILAFVLLVGTGLAVFFIVKAHRKTEQTPSDISSTIQKEAIELKEGYALVLGEYLLPNTAKITKILDPNGKEATLDEGVFKPLTVGVYTVMYGETKTPITVLYKSENMSFTIANDLVSSCSVGESVLIPSVEIKDDYVHYDVYDVVVFDDGVEVEKFENITNNSALSYRFHQSGDYEIAYVCTDIFGQTFTSQKMPVQAKDEKIILFDKLEDRVQYLSKVDLGLPYGYYKGQLYDTKIYLTYPNDKEVELTETVVTVKDFGVYTVTYVCNIDGEERTETQNFEVVAPTSAWAVNAGTIESNAQLPAYSAVKGSAPLMKRSIDFKGSYFNVVDLRELSIEENVISFIPYSTETDYMQTARVTLTDIYDENNKLIVEWFSKAMWGTAHTYLKVMLNGSGYGVSNEGKTYGSLRAGYGTTAGKCSLRGAGNNYTDAFTLQWDNENNRLYTYVGGKQWKVLDTDDEVGLPFNNKFYGFTTGEVYVDIEAVKNDNAGFYLLEVGGKSLMEESETVDYQKDLLLFEKPNMQLPVGAVGYSYPLSQGIQINRGCKERLEIVSCVYKNGEKLTATEGADVFIPQEAGAYELVWETVYQNQIVQKRLPFIVESTPRAFSVSLPTHEQVIAGQLYTIPELNISGGAGDYTVTYTISNVDGVFEYNEYGEYLLDTGKDVSVKIELKDAIGYSETFEYTIIVDATETRLELLGALPRTIKAGSLVSLPDFTAKNYNSSLQLEKKIIVNGSIVLTESPFVFTVPNGNELTVCYIAGAGTAYEKQETYVVRVVGREETNAKLFDVSQNVVENIFLESGYLLKTNVSGKVLGLPCVLPTNGLYFKFGFHENGLAFGEAQIIFADSKDLSKRLVLKIRNIQDGYAELFVNETPTGNRIAYIENTYSADCGNELYIGKKYYVFEFILNTNTRRIETMEGVALAMFDSFIDGTSFKGFFNNVAYVDFALQEVSGLSSFVLCGVGNQFFAYNFDGEDMPSDNVGPIIYAKQELISADVHYGENYIIPFVYASDVLQSYADITVTVTNAKGEKIYNRKPMALNMELSITSYGMYTITYEATDAVGNVSKKQMVLNVLGEEKPTIVINDRYHETYILGDTVVVHSATVSDDVSSNVELSVFIKDSRGKYISVAMGENVVLNRCGTYEIIYRAVDEAGNTTLQVCKFTVNE